MNTAGVVTNEDVRLEIAKKCDQIKALLLEKNQKYGNSALSPVRIMSRASVDEQLRVRIDDKLSRIVRGGEEMTQDEDVVLDLVGYLVLLLVDRELRLRSNL